MAVHAPDRAASIAALPTFSEAAELIGIDPSGISRAVKRLEIQPLRWGNREKHLQVADVLRIAQGANRYSLEEVAGELLDRVERDHPEQMPGIRTEIDEFFAALAPRAATPEDEFIAQLRSTVPPDAAEQLIELYLDAKRSHQ